MKKRMLCALLALVLCAGLLPAASLAAEAPSQTELPVTDNSETAPEGTTPPEATDAPDNTDSATDVDISDATDTSDATDVTDDTDTSDDADTSDDDAAASSDTDTSDADESDDADTADDTDSDDASDEAQSVATTASLSDGEGTSTPITLNTSMTAGTVGQQFTLTLTEAGDYYLEASGATLQLPGKWGDGYRTWRDGEVLQLSAGDHTFTTVTTGSFTLSPLSEKSFTSMQIGKTKTNVSTGESLSKYIYAFTAENEGSYILVPQGAGVSVAVYGKGEDYDGSYTARSTVLTLKKNQTIWVEILVTAAGSVQLIDLANTKELAMDTAVTVATGEVYVASIPSGWYVLETNGADVVSTPRNGGWNWLADSTAARQIFIPQTGNSEPGKGGNSGGFVFAVNSDGTIKLCAAAADDFTSMSENTSYTAKGAYCFTAPSDGNYKITQESASLYDANGQSLSIGWAGYRTMAAGESLYVTLGNYENQSVRIEEKDIPTISLGQTVSVQCKDAVRYSYTAPKAGLYCCLLCGDATYGDGANLSSPNYQNFQYGWFSSGSSRSGYYFLPLNEGQQVYFDLSMANLPSGTGEATMTFNTVEAVFPVKTLNTQFTASKDYDGFRYTPDATGLYVISGKAKMHENGSSQIWIDGRTYVTLEGGKTYIFVTEKANDTVIVQTPEQYGTETIGLNEPKTSSSENLYCFTAPSAGIYSVACENGNVIGYDSTGQMALNGGNGSTGASHQTCTLDKDEKLYLILSPNEGNEAKLTVQQDDLSDLTALELDTVYNKNELTESRYVFQAENAGVYVMTQTENTGAQVMVENSGNRAPEGRIALFSLAAGQKALITIPVNDRPAPPGGGPGGESGGQQSADTLKIAALSSTQVVDVTEEDTELPTADNIYRFTAPADGEYEFSLSVGGMLYQCEVYYYNQSLRQSVMYFEGSDDPSDLRNEHIACTMSKGETVYFVTRSWGGNNAASGEPETGVTKLHVDGLPKVTPTPETVVEKLAAIDETAAPEDIREAVQDIDKDEMTEALETDSDVVDKIAALESKMDGSVSIVVTEDAENAGVSKNVGVIGLKLNNLAAAEGKNITLTIDMAAEKPALPNGISDDGAVYLEIELTGVKNPHSLAVPVCITLAVPEGMDPEKVRLVHYGAERTEVLEPIAVYEAEDGVWYARFVVGGFSPFALAELAANDDGGSAGGNAGGNSGGGTQKPAAKGHSPKTGDESRLLLWAAVLLLACGGAVLVVKKKHN